MTDDQRNFREETRFRVLRLLEQNPALSQRELAYEVGISTGSAHYLLKALLDKGLVKFSNFTASEDKRRYAYVRTPKGIAMRAAMTQKFLARKMREYEALKQEIALLSSELDEVGVNSLGEQSN